MHIASNAAVAEPSGPLVDIPETPIDTASRVTRIAEAVADLEYAIRLHGLFKNLFGVSLTIHIVLSIAFYVLLVAHVGAAMQYGLRWW